MGSHDRVPVVGSDDLEMAFSVTESTLLPACFLLNPYKFEIINSLVLSHSSTTLTHPSPVSAPSTNPIKLVKIKKMTKQKFVVKLSLDDTKKRTKALKTAVTMNGVQSVTVDGDKLVVIGDGTDAIILTTLLRKKLGYADLISVTSGDEKKENKENQPQGVISNVQPLVNPYQYSYSYPYVYHKGAYDHYNFYSIV